MGCLILLMSMIGPRVALVFVWLATGFIERAYDGFVVPALGFIFLPWTTLFDAIVAPTIPRRSSALPSRQWQ